MSIAGRGLPCWYLLRYLLRYLQRRYRRVYQQRYLQRRYQRCKALLPLRLSAL
jgi:hypothetical protein